MGWQANLGEGAGEGGAMQGGQIQKRSAKDSAPSARSCHADYARPLPPRTGYSTRPTPRSRPGRTAITCSAVAASVIECATVNAVMVLISTMRDRTSNIRLNTKARWSMPVRICSTPSATYAKNCDTRWVQMQRQARVSGSEDLLTRFAVGERDRDEDISDGSLEPFDLQRAALEASDTRIEIAPDTNVKVRRPPRQRPATARAEPPLIWGTRCTAM